MYVRCTVARTRTCSCIPYTFIFILLSFIFYLLYISRTRTRTSPRSQCCQLQLELDRIIILIQILMNLLLLLHFQLKQKYLLEVLLEVLRSFYFRNLVVAKYAPVAITQDQDLLEIENVTNPSITRLSIDISILIIIASYSQSHSSRQDLRYTNVKSATRA